MVQTVEVVSGGVSITRASIPYLSLRDVKLRKKREHNTYFLHLKIKRACQFLLGTTMKINHISFKLGFEDPYYFSRIFSEIAGVSPKKYRETRKE